MERDFLIFKETSFSRRKINHNQSNMYENDAEEDEDPLGNKNENNAAANQTEKEVQGRI